jgi:septation ring formation regulator EzrA
MHFRINVVHDNNTELQDELDELRAARKAKEDAKNPLGHVQKVEIRVDKRPLPGGWTGRFSFSKMHV